MPRVVVVAFLPGDIAARMPTLSTDLKLDRDYARKIWEKHRLGHEALGVIQPIIDKGWCTQLRPASLDFLFVDDSRGRPSRYLLGIKAARQGQETWVTTLHLVDEEDIRRRLRKAKSKNALFRTHGWQS